VPDIIAAFEGRTPAGAIAFGTTSAASCVRIVAACRGRKFVSLGSPAVSFDGLADGHRSRSELPRLIVRLVSSNVALQVKARSRGIRGKYFQLAMDIQLKGVSAAKVVVTLR
jgi:hypothetical protein